MKKVFDPAKHYRLDDFPLLKPGIYRALGYLGADIEIAPLLRAVNDLEASEARRKAAFDGLLYYQAFMQSYAGSAHKAFEAELGRSLSRTEKAESNRIRCAARSDVTVRLGFSSASPDSTSSEGSWAAMASEKREAVSRKKSASALMRKPKRIKA